MQDQLQNPYVRGDTELRRSYHGMRDKKLRKLLPVEDDPDAAVVVVHEAFRSMALSDTYTCVVARSAVRRGDYRFGCYPAMGSPEAARAVAADLWDFIREFPIREDRFATFVASFDGPVVAEEIAFEQMLWRQLQLLHEVDVVHHEWDATVSDDPNEQGFSFSFSGRAFFVVGMHAAASRWSRRTAWPTLVFNAHAQFEILRQTGRIQRMKEVVRTRDRRVQGSENPSLPSFERSSETIMYSGRLVEPDWSCPLQVKKSDDRADTECV